MKKLGVFLLIGALMILCFSNVWNTFADRGSTRADIPRVKADAEKLKNHVEALTSLSKPRNYQELESLSEASSYIAKTWTDVGMKVEFQEFKAGDQTYRNVLTTLGPPKAPRIVIGAHYDVAGSQPGADDNASGVAGLLELARLLKARESELKGRIDLVAYCLEEPPFFSTSEMGSAMHARSLKKENAQVRLMLSLEMIGYFSNEKNSQSYPIDSMKLLYSDTGNFIGVIGQLTDVSMVRKIRKLMAQNSAIDVQALNAPRRLSGVDLSDHRSYWDEGFPAVMVTDTAFFRNPNYHTKKDRPETLNFSQMAEVINGVSGVATEF